MTIIHSTGVLPKNGISRVPRHTKSIVLTSISKGDSIDRRFLYVSPNARSLPGLTTFPWVDSIATTIYCTAYMQGSRSMQRDFDCSSLAVTAGLTTFLVSGAFAPLILAPVSEQFGRRGTMLTSSVIFTLCYLPQALAPNITLMLVFRALQGAAASAGYRWLDMSTIYCKMCFWRVDANSLVGGIIADVFVADTRGTPLTILAFMIVAGQSLGAAIYGRSLLLSY